MILVVGGRGRLGTRVCERLSNEGRQVRVMTRTPEKAGHLRQLGAEIVKGDLRDPASVARACQGTTYVVAAAHALGSKGSNNPRTVDGAGNRCLFDVAKCVRVKHLVFVSALWASPNHALEFFRIKHGSEEYLRRSGISYTILRATAFMETWTDVIGQAILDDREATIFGPGTQPVNVISVEDVAHYVLVGLFNPEARDRTLELGGPENLSLNEVVATFERVLSRKAKCKHVPLLAMRLMRALTRPFHGGRSRIMQLRIDMNTADWTFDPAKTFRNFPLDPTRLEDIARRLGAQEGSRTDDPETPVSAVVN